MVLAKLLATRPRTLLLYDCTRGVDVGTKTEIYELLEEFAAGGGAVLLYSTEVDEHQPVRPGARRARRPDRGQLSGGDGTLTDENLIRASVGEPVKPRSPA